MAFEKNFKNYSLALFEIAKDEKKIEKYFDQAIILEQILMENKPLISIISSYDLNFGKKEEIIQKSFKAFDENIINWLKIIAKNNLFFKIISILEAFIKNISLELNIKSCIVYSSVKLSPIKLKKIEEKLSKTNNSKIIIKNIIDKTLISGLRIEIDNKIVESSIRLELEQLSYQLKGAKKWQ